jgi:hypothetical protein
MKLKRQWKRRHPIFNKLTMKGKNKLHQPKAVAMQLENSIKLHTLIDNMTSHVLQC